MHQKSAFFCFSAVHHCPVGRVSHRSVNIVSPVFLSSLLFSTILVTLINVANTADVFISSRVLNIIKLWMQQNKWNQILHIHLSAETPLLMRNGKFTDFIITGIYTDLTPPRPCQNIQTNDWKVSVSRERQLKLRSTSPNIVPTKQMAAAVIVAEINDSPVSRCPACPRGVACCSYWRISMKQTWSQCAAAKDLTLPQYERS